MENNELFPTLQERKIARESQTMRAIKFLSRMSDSEQRKALAETMERLIIAGKSIEHLIGDEA